MLTIERCKEILKQNGSKMSSEEIKELLPLLYMWANLNNELNEDNDDECTTILPSEHR